MPENPDQRRPVSFSSATVLVIANMIGTGVFTTLGLQLSSVHYPFSAIMLWVAGGVVAFCGALSYGELGSMMPRSGGEYAYLSEIYHPAIGFLSGCSSMVAGFGAPVALAAIALGRYSAAVFPWADQRIVAVLAIVILSLVHLFDVRFGCHFQNVFTAGKILLIGVFIAAGFLSSHPQQSLLPTSGKELEQLLSPAFAVGLVYVSYAYSGWNASSYIAGEIRDPERNLPVSLFLGTLFVSLCYVLLNLVFLLTVPAGELAGKIDVGFLSARAIFGETSGRFVTVLICLALISSLSSMIMAGPRVIQAMGEDIGIIGFFADRNKRGVPVRAILLQSSVSILLALTSAFDIILTYVGFTLALFTSLTVLGVFILRIRKPAQERPFKTWGYPVTPALFLVLNAWMLFYLLVHQPLPSVIGLLTVASALVFYSRIVNSRGQSALRRRNRDHDSRENRVL